MGLFIKNLPFVRMYDDLAASLQSLGTAIKSCLKWEPAIITSGLPKNSLNDNGIQMSPEVEQILAKPDGSMSTPSNLSPGQRR